MDFLKGLLPAFLKWLLGKIFPSTIADPSVVAQAQRDRADELQAREDARDESQRDRMDAEESLSDIPGSVSGANSGVFKPDANERTD